MAVEAVYQRNPIPYDRSKLTVRHMDMTQIEYPDASFDFIWSCCSIEHVHNFTLLHQVFKEIHRVLKPGGIAALTTEFNPTDLHSYEPNMLFTDAYWLQHWLTKEDCIIQGLELLDSIDLSLSEDARNLPQARRYPDNSIQIYCDDVVLNSVAFFLRKTTDSPVEYVEESWLPEFWRIYLSGCDCRREGSLKEAEGHFKSALNLAGLEQRDRIRTLHYLGNVLAVQAKVDEAKDVAKELLDLCLSSPPLDDQEYPTKPITSLMAIAGFCDNIGFTDEAQKLYQRVVLSKASTMEVVVHSILKQSEYCRNNQDYNQAIIFLNDANQLLQNTGLEPVFTARIQYAYGKCFRALNQTEKALVAYWKLIQGSSTIINHFSLLMIDFIDILLTDGVIEEKTIAIQINGEAIALTTILQHLSRHLEVLTKGSEPRDLIARLYLRTGLLALKLGKQDQDKAIALNYFQSALDVAPADSSVRKRAQTRFDNVSKKQAAAKTTP